MNRKGFYGGLPALVLGVICLGVSPLTAQQAPEKQAPEKQATEKQAWFVETMTGATLVGRFTITGQDASEMAEDQYQILKCERLDDNLYRITSRIQYGEVDQELPLEIPVEWAGDTPVISLTNMWIPGMGTFSARVLIYEGAYAGTWAHDKVGGHMFGIIKKTAPEDSDKKTPDDVPENG